jgi:ketosteroid isomerase-like protein
MNRTVMAALLGALLASPAYAQKKGAAEEEVVKAYRELDHVETITKDRATMERLMATDYLYTHSNGTVANKTQDIAENMSSTQKWTASKQEELKVRFYGDVAVITGIQTLTGSAKGYVAGPRRFTDIWVKRAGHWQNVGGQSTLIPAK